MWGHWLGVTMTHFNWYVDGSIVGLYLVATMVAGLAVRKYVGKVEHFLVAGREMNVYLGIASLAATEFGVVTCMYTAQNGYDKGFAGAVPGLEMALAMFLIGWTGFCVKPLRNAGVMTIPELFEKCYGPRIRWLAGVVIVLGGLLNMGVFLRTGGEFLVLVGSYKTQPLATIIAATSVVFAAAYMLWALQRIIYNPMTKPENEGLKDLNWREIGLMVPLLIAILWLGVYPKPLLDKTEPAARRLVESVQTAAARTPARATNGAR